MKNLSLLNNYEWPGEFYIAGNKRKKFSGILSYTPTSGVRLRVLIIGKYKKITHDDILHGNLHDKGKVTLLSITSDSDFNFPLTSATSSEFNLSFGFAIFGQHLSEKKIKFDRCSFRLNNIENLASPFNSQRIPYIKQALLNKKIDEFDLELRTNASGPLVFDLVKEELIIQNPEFQHDLDSAYKEVSTKYPNDYIALKRKVNLIFNLTKSKKTTPQDFLKTINRINSLFSILLIKTIKPIELTFMNKNSSKSFTYFQVLLPLHITDKQLNDLSNDKVGSQIGIHFDAITDLEKTYNKWKSFLKNEPNLLHETFFSRNALDPSTYQYFILLLSGIEQFVSQDQGNTKLYLDYFIKRYSTEKIIERLSENTPPLKNGDSLAKIICDMRNCLVHSNKLRDGSYSRFRNYINIIHIGNICELLLACSLIAIYEKIEIDTQCLDEFKRNVLNHIFKYTFR